MQGEEKREEKSRSLIELTAECGQASRRIAEAHRGLAPKTPELKMHHDLIISEAGAAMWATQSPNSRSVVRLLQCLSKAICTVCSDGRRDPGTSDDVLLVLIASGSWQLAEGEDPCSLPSKTALFAGTKGYSGAP